jgi:hypothetical protein
MATMDTMTDTISVKHQRDSKLVKNEKNVILVDAEQT